MTYFNLAVYCENEIIKIKAETIYKVSSEEATKSIKAPHVIITSLDELPPLNLSDRPILDFSSLDAELHALTQNAINFSGYELPPYYDGNIEQFKMDTVIYELPTKPLLAIHFILLLHYSQYNTCAVRYNRSFETCLVDNQINYYLPIFGGEYDNIRTFFDDIISTAPPLSSMEEIYKEVFLEYHLLIGNFVSLKNKPSHYYDVFTHLNTLFLGSLCKYINYRSLNNAYQSDQVLLEQYNEMLPELKRLNMFNQSNPLKNNGFFSHSEKRAVNPERSSRACQCTIL
ncbi:hypothetical protein [Legionella fairfieldensis]|uniref:hypothetical protein n=1 Tax=Legionella fairfieldensis TaxID=45064 RepID=UPI00048B039F|nr:hypothetical protein [Legionella fairfieldensis]